MFWMTESYLKNISHLRTEVSFIASAGNIIQVLSTGAQPGVHVSHLALHQLYTEQQKTHVSCHCSENAILTFMQQKLD